MFDCLEQPNFQIPKVMLFKKLKKNLLAATIEVDIAKQRVLITQILGWQ